MPGKPKGSKKTGGRKAGTPNVFSTSVRQSVLDAFHKMQQDPEANLFAWGKRKPTEFYMIASKLIPTEVTGSVAHVLTAKVDAGN